jgi:ABC-type multidrug transport system ATPase subunit
VLQFISAGKKHGTRWAPLRASLKVVPGETVWLGGPSGSGKSVLVRMALGIVTPDSGSVLVGETNIFRAPHRARQRIRRTISAVLDDEPPVAVPAGEWLATGLWCAGRSWERSLKTAREAMEKFGISGDSTHPYGGLGRETRFAFSLVRALGREPKLLMIDWAGAFSAQVPVSLLDELVRFVADGGACLVTGTMTDTASRLGGRQAVLEPPGTAA